jgi:hypothetical protein
MALLFLLLGCGEEPEEPTCVEWVDSCSGCEWMCTDESLEPNVVCDIECTIPHPEGTCVLTEESTCAFE